MYNNITAYCRYGLCIYIYLFIFPKCFDLEMHRGDIQCQHTSSLVVRLRLFYYTALHHRVSICAMAQSKCCTDLC